MESVNIQSVSNKNVDTIYIKEESIDFKEDLIDIKYEPIEFEDVINNKQDVQNEICHGNNQGFIGKNTNDIEVKNLQLEHTLNHALTEYLNFLSEISISSNHAEEHELNNKGELSCSITDIKILSKCIVSVTTDDNRIEFEDFCIYCKVYLQHFIWHHQKSHSNQNQTNTQTSTVSSSDKSDSASVIISSDSECYDSDADPRYMPSASCNDEVQLEHDYDSMTENNSLSGHFEINTVKNQQESNEFRQNDDNSSSAINQMSSVSENTEENKRIRQKDFCIYCESSVSNFARHLRRHHMNEIEVQKCFSYATGSLKRKSLFSLIRKKGNYAHNDALIKPVRKPNFANLKNSNYLPCVYCLGFYSKKHITRHTKKCVGNPNNGEVAQLADCQNLLVKHLKIDRQLANTVFRRMRADHISLAAKQDSLICAYGAKYIKIHQGTHFINVASRRMRELARLLIEMRKIEPKIKTLFQCLNPVYFQNLITAAKLVSNYDSDRRNCYHSPTYLQNINSALKECCNIANTLDVFGVVAAAEAETQLNAMIELLQNNWRFEILNRTGNDLNGKKLNKITIVPLVNELKKFHEYLLTTSTSCALHLQENSNNQNAYIQLLETVYCRMILLNRRAGELEKMPLFLYKLSKQNAEDFQNIVSPAELILSKRFQRIVIRDTRGRGIALLFHLDVQHHIELLLKYRDHFVPKTNIYLFAKTNCDLPIIGYKVLDKHIAASGVKNDWALTTAKLHKHITTIMQMIQFTTDELEELATFLGHPDGVYNKTDDDDVTQIAKLSKLLLLMEKDRSLDDLNIEEELADESDSHTEDMPEYQNLVPDNNEPSSSKQLAHKTNKTNMKIKRNLVAWKPQQRMIAKEFFQKHILHKRAPKKRECMDLISRHAEVFANKSWLKIKVFIQNLYTKKSK